MGRSPEIYRESTIGRCLKDALTDLVFAGKITPLLAVQVIMQFDKSMSQVFAKEVKELQYYVHIKGHVREYNYINDVWKFDLDNVFLKIRHNEIPTKFMGNDPLLCEDVTQTDRLKVVTLDGYMFRR